MGEETRGRKLANLVMSEERPYWRGGTHRLELWRVTDASGETSSHVMVSCAPVTSYEPGPGGDLAEVARDETMAFDADEKGVVNDWSCLYRAVGKDATGGIALEEMGYEVARA